MIFEDMTREQWGELGATETFYVTRWQKVIIEAARAGMRGRLIAQELGTNSNSVKSTLSHLRRLGVDIPFAPPGPLNPRPAPRRYVKRDTVYWTLVSAFGTKARPFKRRDDDGRQTKQS